MPQIIDKSATTPAATDYLLSQASAGTTSKVTPVAVRDGGAVYGALYYSDTGSSITLTTQNTWYGFTGAVEGELRGITADVADATADHLTIVTSGTYRMTLTACYSTTGTPNGAGTYELSAHVDGVECTSGCATRRYLSAGDVGSVAGHSIVPLTAGQEVSIRARCTSASTRALTVERLCLSLERVGA